MEGYKGGIFVFMQKIRGIFNIDSMTTLSELDKFIEANPAEPMLEEAWWKRAILLNNSQGYDDYLNHYRRGKFAGEALRLLEQREEEEYWNIVLKKKTKTAVYEYLNRYHNGRFTNQAEEILRGLRAESLSIMDSSPQIEDLVPPPSIKNQPEAKSPSILDSMVLVYGGSFEMGDVMGDEQASRKAFGITDLNIHEVILNTFYIGKYAVTFSEYDSFCESTSRILPIDYRGWGRGKRPVVGVSWFDAIAYCNWRSEIERLEQVYEIEDNIVTPNWDVRGYRLPTEAEWEYAARERGKAVRFGNGRNIADPRQINFDASEEIEESYYLPGEFRKKTVEVGSLPPNSLGLHEMSGNVLEWCWDRYGTYPTTPQYSPRGPENGRSLRVLRGGAWDSSANGCRVTGRERGHPDSGNLSLGFRLALNY